MNLIRNTYRGEYPIHLILDNWSVHKTKIFRETAEKLNIHLHYCPTSAPYYNKIELNLNRQIQDKVLKRSEFENIEDTKRAIVEWVDEKYNLNAFHNNTICLKYC